MDQPIEQRRMYGLLADRLVVEIGDRSPKPGGPLPTERELQQMYGVGRSSVREALRILESLGLIKPSGRRVFLVADYGMTAGLTSQDRCIAADLQLHAAVAAATSDRLALTVMHAIRDLLRRALASIYHIPGSLQRSIAQHRQILDAIRAGAAAVAHQRMREHLLKVEGDIQDILRKTAVTI